MAGGGKERREHQRVDVNLRVRVRYDNVDDFVDQFAPNISKGGLFIQSREPYPVGTQLQFEIQLKDGSSVLRGMGKVTWSQPPAGPQEKPRVSGMGVKFLGLDAASREMVSRILERKEERAEAPTVEEEPAPAKPAPAEPTPAEPAPATAAPVPVRQRSTPAAPIWRRVPLRVWLLAGGAALGALVVMLVLSLTVEDAQVVQAPELEAASARPEAVLKAPERTEPPRPPPPPEPERVAPPPEESGGEVEEAELAPRPIPESSPQKLLFGYLSLNTDPWVEVYLGPRKLGVTPLVGVKLRAGKHRLRLVNYSEGIDSPLVVTVRSGKTTKLVKQFSR